MTGWIVLGCIILFFVLLFTVRASVTVEFEDELFLTVRVLGIPIHILPQKDKKYNPRDYTLKKIRKRDQLAAEKEALKQEKKKASKKKKQAKAAEKKATKKKAKEAKKDKPSPLQYIPLICRVLGLFFSRFFGKLHIKVAKLHIRIGSSEAMQTAVLYGAANQSVQYLLTFLGKIAHVDGLKKADIQIVPDFLSEKIEVSANITVRLTLGHVLGAVFKAGWTFFIGFLKIKPDPLGIKPPKVPKAPKPPRAPKAPKPEKRA